MLVLDCANNLRFLVDQALCKTRQSSSGGQQDAFLHLVDVRTRSLTAAVNLCWWVLPTLILPQQQGYDL